MRVIEKQVQLAEEESVTLSYVRYTKLFQKIKDFCMTQEVKLPVYSDTRELISLSIADIYYLEVVDDKVYIYTENQVYQSSNRLYELEDELGHHRIIRISRGMLLNVNKVVSIRSALNSRFYAKLENGEEVLVTRKYAKAVTVALTEDGEESGGSRV